MSLQRLASKAAARLLDTNIVYGMMLSILLEESDRLKPNTVQLYLVGRSIKSSHDCPQLDFYQANLISKRSSTLLRLLRHFVCGHIVNTAKSGAYKTQTTFENATLQLIRTIQTCITIDASSRVIRMAKEIDAKTPSYVKKGFDPSTGEVMVERHYIARNVWSSAIPEMCKMMRQHLFPLFHTDSYDLVETVLDIGSKLVMSVDECYVYRKGEYKCYRLLSFPKN